jgi:hypothetical protein
MSGCNAEPPALYNDPNYRLGGTADHTDSLGDGILSNGGDLGQRADQGNADPGPTCPTAPPPGNPNGPIRIVFLYPCDGATVTLADTVEGKLTVSPDCQMSCMCLLDAHARIRIRVDGDPANTVTAAHVVSMTGGATIPIVDTPAGRVGDSTKVPLTFASCSGPRIGNPLEITDHGGQLMSVVTAW